MTNPLSLIPAKYRAAVYAGIGIAALGFTAWQAADGDWVEALAGFVIALGNATSASNINPDA